MGTFEYHSLPTKPGDVDAPPASEDFPSSKKRYWARLFPCTVCRRIILLLVTSILFLVIIFTIYVLTHRDLREECGTSPTEARQRGCAFDPILMGWVPRRCYDHPLTQDFFSDIANYTFHQTADRTASDIIGQKEVLEGEWDIIYVDPQFYITQCMCAWKKTWRAAVNGSVLDGYLGDEHQRNHCEMLVTEGPEREKSLHMKYVSCRIWDGSVGSFGWYTVIGGERVYRADA